MNLCTKIKEHLKFSRFLNSNAEKENLFSLTNLPIQLMLLKISMVIALLLIFLSWITSSPEELKSNPTFFALRLIMITLIPIIYGISRSKKISVEYLLLLLHLISFFTIAENFKKGIQSGSRHHYFILGVYLEILPSTLIISKIGWLKSVLFIVIINMSLVLYIPSVDFLTANYFPLLQTIFIGLTLSLFSYIVEKKNRENFYSAQKNEFSLLCFKELIKNVFPNPVIITQGEDILFENEEALKTFNCKTKAEMINCFKNIIIDSKYDIYMNSDQNISIESRDLLEKIEKRPSFNKDWKNFWYNDIGTPFRTIKELEKFCLLDFLRNAKDLINTKKSFVKTFRSVFNNQLNQTTYYFDIKIKNIIWEEKHALMVIISENRSIQMVKHLTEQAIYKDHLLATVSHDLRTPLNGIIGMIYESISLALEPLVRKNLNVALRSAKYLLFMINDILDLHQISSGKMRLNFEYFSLWDCIYEVSKLIKFQAKLKGLKFIRENKVSKKDPKAFIRSDPNRLRQIILNLLGNALKFTPSGSITISLEETECGMEAEDDCFYRSDYIIKVTDTGIGIKKEDQGKLFILFGRLEINERTMNKTGIGLGLAISQNLVKILNNNLLNCEIKVKSEPKKGSCFYFPLCSAPENASEENFISQISELGINKPYFNDEKRRSFKSCFHTVEEFDNDQELNITEEKQKEMPVNILVVDDDQINILVASSYLKSNKYCSIDIAHDGAQALEKIRLKAEEDNFYNIILMDCNMPIMNGFEASMIIRDLISLHTIPDLIIIACTANASQDDYEQCFKVGMNDYIAKPFTKVDLFRILSKYSHSFMPGIYKET